MNSPDTGPRNRLLVALSLRDLRQLSSSLETAPLEARQVLEAPHEPIEHVYFVESGLVSVVGAAEPDHRIEVGMVGYEGMTGLGVVLGDDRSDNETIVQSAGTAWRISSGALRKAMKANPTLGVILLRYVNVFIGQASQTALANGRGRLDERLACGLLMWHDRVGHTDLIVTHEFLALLLGVRRPGVTVALHDLEGRGLIRASRNLVRILDREGLHEAANGSTALPKLNTSARSEARVFPSDH